VIAIAIAVAFGFELIPMHVAASGLESRQALSGSTRSQPVIIVMQEDRSFDSYMRLVHR